MPRNLNEKRYVPELFSGVFLLGIVLSAVDLKPLDTFGTETQLKVHRFTNNLQGLQKVMVKDFSWNIIPWNALLFEKTIKHPVIFSRLRWPIEPKFTQVCYFI